MKSFSLVFLSVSSCFQTFILSQSPTYYQSIKLFDSNVCSKDSLSSAVYMLDSYGSCPHPSMQCTALPGSNSHGESKCITENPSDDIKLSFDTKTPFVGSIMFTDSSCKNYQVAAYFKADGSCINYYPQSMRFSIESDGSATSRIYSNVSCKGDSRIERVTAKDVGVCIYIGEKTSAMLMIGNYDSKTKGSDGDRGRDVDSKGKGFPVIAVVSVIAVFAIIGVAVMFRENVRREFARLTMQAATISGAPQSKPSGERQGLLA